jgi:hypothetical protein
MRRLFPWLSGLILVAGLITFTVVYFGTNTAKPLPPSATPTGPVQVVKPEKKVPVPKEAKLVAGKFILTAVQRKHLERALPLVTNSIRQDMTRQEWMTGNIPVVPWLGRIGVTPLKVDYSHPREVEFTVAILPAKGDKTQANYFVIVLKKVGSGSRARWLVDQWVPREAPPIPANPVG